MADDYKHLVPSVQLPLHPVTILLELVFAETIVRNDVEWQVEELSCNQQCLNVFLNDNKLREVLDISGFCRFS